MEAFSCCCDFDDRLAFYKKEQDLLVQLAQLRTENERLKSENARLRSPWGPGERKKRFDEDNRALLEHRKDMLREAKLQTDLLSELLKETRR